MTQSKVLDLIMFLGLALGAGYILALVRFGQVNAISACFASVGITLGLVASGSSLLKDSKPPAA